MLEKLCGIAIVIGALTSMTALAQAPSAQPPVPAPAGGAQKVGQIGNLDAGVQFINVVENPNVRVLQVTLQPGAIRRPHLHNDVMFNVLVPITGSLDLTVEKEPVITAIPGQAYYLSRGQTHSFTNKGSAAVQVIELFVMPPAAAPTPAP